LQIFLSRPSNSLLEKEYLKVEQSKGGGGGPNEEGRKETVNQIIISSATFKVDAKTNLIEEGRREMVVGGTNQRMLFVTMAGGRGKIRNVQKGGEEKG